MHADYTKMMLLAEAFISPLIDAGKHAMYLCYWWCFRPQRGYFIYRFDILINLLMKPHFEALHYNFIGYIRLLCAMSLIFIDYSLISTFLLAVTGPPSPAANATPPGRTGSVLSAARSYHDAYRLRRRRWPQQSLSYPGHRSQRRCARFQIALSQPTSLCFSLPHTVSFDIYFALGIS
jgi:hypothetical protein